MKIARSPHLANSAYTPILPASWGTLYEDMTMEQQIAEAKARAEALAEPIIVRGEAAGAAEVDQLKARWARQVLDNAAGAADTFPAADFEKWIAELGANLKAAESTNHAHAVLDRKDTELREALAARALEAWRAACEKLAHGQQPRSSRRPV